MDTFLTTNRHDYVWPYPKPFVAVPSQPPLVTKPRGIYEERPVMGSCSCQGHGWNPLMRRYVCLADKERKLTDEINAIQPELVQVTNDIMDFPCGEANEKSRTLYMQDYCKKGYDPAAYKDIMIAADSPIGTTVECKIGLQNGYRDPTSFLYTPLPRPSIDPNREVTFGTTPLTMSVYHEPFPGRTEYQDTISKMGLAAVKSSQQYKEPLPSSRRRFGDPCL